MGNTIRRRLSAIKVDEISLVDRPANEKEFAVIKRQEEEKNMGKTSDENVAVAGNAPEGTTSDGNAEASAKPTVDNVEQLAKKVDELTALLQPSDAVACEKNHENETADQKPVENKEEVQATETKEPLAALGESIAHLTEVVKAFIAKSAEQPAKTESASSGDATVEKSILNPARLDRVRKAFKEFYALMKDIDADGMSSLMSEGSSEQSTESSTQAGEQVQKSVTPSLEEVIQKSLAPIMAQVDAVQKKLQGFESMTAVSKSVGGDGNDGVAESTENVFKGIV
jgi:hypothetical protein